MILPKSLLLLGFLPALQAQVAPTPPALQAQVAHAQPAARLYATDDGAVVRLQWQPGRWSADQRGFVIKRRVTGTTAWAALPSGLIRPSYDPAREGIVGDAGAEHAA